MLQPQFSFLCTGPQTVKEPGSDCQETGSGTGLYPLSSSVLSWGSLWNSALMTYCWGWRRPKMMGTWRLSCWPSLGKQGPQAESQHLRGTVSLWHWAGLGAGTRWAQAVGEGLQPDDLFFRCLCPFCSAPTKRPSCPAHTPV